MGIESKFSTLLLKCSSYFLMNFLTLSKESEYSMCNCTSKTDEI